MPPNRPKVVFDCNVFLQAIARSEGPAAACIRLVERGFITLYLSKPIIREVREVLADAAVRSHNPMLSDELVDSFLRSLIYRSELIRDMSDRINYPRDVNDEKYLELADVSKANYLVTRDRDLLDIMSGHDLIAKSLRRQLSFLSILDPLEFLDELRDKMPEAFT